MADSGFVARLREIDSNLRELARSRRRMDGKDVTAKLEELSADLRGAILDLEQPTAGTSAYEMVAAVEGRNVEVTETLIHMVAATVLMQIADRDGTPMAEPLTITFSPADMDRMHQHYDMTAKHDGMLTTISLRPRDAAEIAPPLALHADDAWIDATPAAPQAEEHVHDRPLWAVRVEGKLYPASDQVQAERVAMRYASEDRVSQVENRFCYHDDCPASGCNHAADASC